MRRALAIGLPAAALVTWGVWLVLVARVPLPLEAVPAGPDTLVGAYHVHTERSDGRRSLEALAALAKKAQLDFLILDDHNVEPLPAAFVDGILMVPAVELSTPAGHVSALGTTRTADAKLRQAAPLEAAASTGGLVVLSHPVNRRNPWTGGWEGVDGMEVVSGDSLWREALAHPFSVLLPALAATPASLRLAVLSLQDGSPEARRLWAERHALGDPVLGLCAHDTHGYLGDGAAFEVMRTHVRLGGPLPEDAEAAGEAVIRALAEGRSFCALDGLADGRGFTLQSKGDGVRAALAYTDWPESVPTRVRLLRGSTLVAEGEREAVHAPAEPGVYRAEVTMEAPWMGGTRSFLWILAGPVRVDP